MSEELKKMVDGLIQLCAENTTRPDKDARKWVALMLDVAVPR